ETRGEETFAAATSEKPVPKRVILTTPGNAPANTAAPSASRCQDRHQLASRRARRTTGTPSRRRTTGPQGGRPTGTPPRRALCDMRAWGSVRARDGEPAAHMDVLAAVPKARISHSARPATRTTAPASR